jgi:hypothetical protein
MRRALLALAASALVLTCASAAMPQGRPITMAEPDGTIFVTAPDGGAKHTATGFVCPANLSGMTRRGLYIFDTADHGRDVACGYGEPGSTVWYTLYLAKLEVKDSKKVFEDDVREEQQGAPPRADAKAPLMPGLPPLPQRAAFWVSNNDMIDGLWFTSIGSWHVNLRATFAAGHEPEVSATAKSVFSQVFDQVKGPET